MDVSRFDLLTLIRCRQAATAREQPEPYRPALVRLTIPCRPAEACGGGRVVMENGRLGIPSMSSRMYA